MIVRKEGDTYYAILKDERYPTLEWMTGKAIRICRSPSLLGPYSEPATLDPYDVDRVRARSGPHYLPCAPGW